MRPHILVVLLLSALTALSLPLISPTFAAAQSTGGAPPQEDSGGAQAQDDPYHDDGSWVNEGEDDAWSNGRKNRPSTAMLHGVPYRTLILTHARRNQLDPAFVAAVIHSESAFNRRAKSPVGARGLMQLMPATARWLGGRVSLLFRPTHNIKLGTKYLNQVRGMVGNNPRLMAAAYNAGPGAVQKFHGIPPYAETRAYVKRVIRMRAVYAKR